MTTAFHAISDAEASFLRRLEASSSVPSDYDADERAAIEGRPASGVQRVAPDPFACLSVEDLAAPLPPVPWLVERLGIAPGAPTIVAGYGYSRKTLALQDLALAVATGRDVWGVYAARRGAVLHLDYEQGRRQTQERYQRLARGRGFELRELDAGTLRVSVLPSLYLDHRRAEDAMLRACDGVALCIVDSFRAACPSVDENASVARKPLDVLGRVSERTGCVVVVVHHMGKPPKEASAETQAHHGMRGSSSLFDACASVFILAGKKGEATRAKHEKDRQRGQCLEDFGLDAQDVKGPDGDPRWGLRVVHLEGDQISARTRARQSTPEERLAEVCRAVLECIKRSPGAGKRVVRELVRGEHGARNTTIDVALDLLLERRLIVSDKEGYRAV